MDEDDLEAAAQAYADKYRLVLAEHLGSGIHGRVYTAVSNDFLGRTALKVHYDLDIYQREKQIYARLRRQNVTAILGFDVPQFVNCDDELLAFEMTVVQPPFLLDFAGAYLDKPPDFPAEVWEEWGADKREQFGERWEIVQTALAHLQSLGIYMVDPSPKNIRFE